MDLLQFFLLGLVQGITEFLPISSSAHLILIPYIIGQQDQGLLVDVAAHAGTLMAVLIYFRRDIKNIVSHGIMTKPWDDNIWESKNINARLFWLLILATVPVLVAAFFGRDLISLYLREPLLIAAASAFFAALLWWADIKGKRNRDDIHLNLRDAIWVGLAQVLALIPGTSRSGIAITACLMLGMNRGTAARFALLLSIPVISVAGCYETFVLFTGTTTVDLLPFMIVFFVSWCTASLTIKIFLEFVERTGMFPYVIYRFLLTGLILYFFL